MRGCVWYSPQCVLYNKMLIHFFFVPSFPQPADCPNISINNSILSSSFPFRYRELVTVSCQDGYILEGASTARCLLRGWSKALGTCKSMSRFYQYQWVIKIEKRRLLETAVVLSWVSTFPQTVHMWHNFCFHVLLRDSNFYSYVYNGHDEPSPAQLRTATGPKSPIEDGEIKIYVQQ